ncbi:MAG: hypothetical protein NC340_05105 [Ruminococcus flavefaciens]|nr:hypothetical protein [Ruminococcus flavefaciens]MCM1231090.1 hypothetical protein [Ruminococcus flavefaciens]
MVKGVNKKIIEVNNPDSIYFERAVFYLRPEVRTLPDEIARREIDRYIISSGLAERRRITAKTGRIIIFSAVVAVILAIVIISAV